ncbi:MAG: hypothetical protein L0229_22665 [Blastocatellia bacterium]|nr:hypothetical protein [Blastocatellia bacterium]
MGDVRKAIPKVEAVIKQADPEVIVQGTLYDEVSGRLFVTLIKGVRKKIITLPAHYFDGDMERVKQAIERGVERLQEEPVG